MKREELKSKDFYYDLPDERIAKYPLANRNKSKLLLYKNGEIGEDKFSNLKAHLPLNSILVFNDTKVLAARLYFKKPTGAKIEIFCLEPFEKTVEQALNATEICHWQCMVGNLKRFKPNEVLQLEIAGTTLCASIIEKRENDVIIQFEWGGAVEFSKILETAGKIPLPPYMNRETELEDKESYQTVYASTKGAVAAPTAGLHFVDHQLKELAASGHELVHLTLYVGAGTFRPLKTDTLVDHKMHKERIVVSKKSLNQLLQNNGKIICVGTTSLRSLESLYWLAVKMFENKDNTIRVIEQEDAYQLITDWSWQQAFEYLLLEMKQTDKNEIDFHSALFIMPSYQWKVIDGLITNFHQPNSTLLALVSAWVGTDWKKLYDYALNNNYRFLSYGDSSLLLK